MTRQQSVWVSALMLIASVTAMSVPFASTANAGEREFNATYSVNDDTAFKLEFGVGSVTFERSSDDSIEVEMIAKPSEKKWFGKANLEAVELNAEQDGDRLVLTVPEQDGVTLQWVIRVPRIAELNVDLGVGQIAGDVYASDMDINLGIGDIDLEVYGDVDSVKTDVGIGDTHVSGAEENSNDRAFISASSRAKGKGDARINIDTGIGDITVRIK
ncbi:hypothetical protein CWI80_01720 [Pseudidiomarina sediminum]|uniref:Adhesin domain-containing protein n=1 Tax=Pseudidiomarina sediminum TaxID=431675 RepID=A0A432Z898_9GAMM|nr:hypothetical protein [Pseudidiomarina sediminum]RUO74104.1 hypothetical protein CWI80_01720 [Pseudidiomarina sediminum]